jgi:ribosomal protein S18 acetylase RimI-like enzyme
MQARDSRDGDLQLLLELSQELWRQDPRCVTCNFGQIAFWSGNLVHGEHQVRLWSDGDELVGWGWLTRGVELEWQVRPERPELLDEILEWARPSEALVLSHHTDAISRLEAHGLAHDPAAPWMRVNSRLLEQIEQPHVPEGFALRTVEERDFASRAAAHRSAFHPSRFRDDVYAAVRESWAYRPELDCVVEAPDGSIAAYALAWLDDMNGLGELEPVGTHADYRRLGLGRAVNLFALAQLRDLGATRALVASRGDDAYPAPSKLYESVGFRKWMEQLAYVRR